MFRKERYLYFFVLLHYCKNQTGHARLLVYGSPLLADCVEQCIAGIFGSSGKFTKRHFIISMQKMFKEMSNFTAVSVSLTYFSFFFDHKMVYWKRGKLHVM